jgi:hypothetical protein
MAIPFVILKLDKTYHLRLGLRTIVEYEQSTKKKLMDVSEELESGIVSMVTVAQLLHAMMKKENPELTFEDVCDLVDEHIDKVAFITEKVVEAINASLEVNDDNPNVKAPTEK